jgi:hypothetical protein
MFFVSSLEDIIKIALNIENKQEKYPVTIPGFNSNGEWITVVINDTKYILYATVIYIIIDAKKSVRQELLSKLFNLDPVSNADQDASNYVVYNHTANNSEPEAANGNNVANGNSNDSDDECAANGNNANSNDSDDECAANANGNGHEPTNGNKTEPAINSSAVDMSYYGRQSEFSMIEIETKPNIPNRTMLIAAKNNSTASQSKRLIVYNADDKNMIYTHTTLARLAKYTWCVVSLEQYLTSGSNSQFSHNIPLQNLSTIVYSKSLFTPHISLDKLSKKDFLVNKYILNTKEPVGICPYRKGSLILIQALSVLPFILSSIVAYEGKVFRKPYDESLVSPFKYNSKTYTDNCHGCVVPLYDDFYILPNTQTPKENIILCPVCFHKNSKSHISKVTIMKHPKTFSDIVRTIPSNSPYHPLIDFIIYLHTANIEPISLNDTITPRIYDAQLIKIGDKYLGFKNMNRCIMNGMKWLKTYPNYKLINVTTS